MRLSWGDCHLGMHHLNYCMTKSVETESTWHLLVTMVRTKLGGIGAAKCSLHMPSETLHLVHAIQKQNCVPVELCASIWGLNGEHLLHGKKALEQ